MARPKKAATERRSELLQLRMTKGERAQMQHGANSFEQRLTEFIRQAALEKAARAKPKTP